MLRIADMNERTVKHIDKRIRRGETFPTHMLRPMIRILPYCKTYWVGKRHNKRPLIREVM